MSFEPRFGKNVRRRIPGMQLRVVKIILMHGHCHLAVDSHPVAATVTATVTATATATSTAWVMLQSQFL